MVMKWRDRRDVHMITTFHTNKMVVTDKVDFTTQEKQKKPMCLVEYGARMEGVNRVDMILSSITCSVKPSSSGIIYINRFHLLDICMSS